MTSALNNEEAAASSPLWAAPLASAGPAGCGTREQSWSSREHFDRELCKNKRTRNRSSVSRSQQSTETTHLLHLNTDTCCVFFLFNKSLQPHFSQHRILCAVKISCFSANWASVTTGSSECFGSRQGNKNRRFEHTFFKLWDAFRSQKHEEENEWSFLIMCWSQKHICAQYVSQMETNTHVNAVRKTTRVDLNLNVYIRISDDVSTNVLHVTCIWVMRV